MRFTHAPPPKIGDIRQKTKFLLLPETIGNETRWLERATWEEKYQRCTYFWDVDGEILLAWLPTKWITEEHK